MHAEVDILPDPIYPPSAIEPKTIGGTAGAGAGSVVSGFVIYLLSELLYGGGPVPLPASLFVALLVTTGLTFAASYYAKHVNRVG